MSTLIGAPCSGEVVGTGNPSEGTVGIDDRTSVIGGPSSGGLVEVELLPLIEDWDPWVLLGPELGLSLPHDAATNNSDPANTATVFLSKGKPTLSAVGSVSRDKAGIISYRLLLLSLLTYTVP